MKTDWDRLDSMTDEEIDYSDIPPLGDDFFTRARVVIAPAKRAEYVRLDPDLRAWFEEHDQDYPALINLVLRKYVEIQTELVEQGERARRCSAGGGG